jgi:hypothetical protein
VKYLKKYPEELDFGIWGFWTQMKMGNEEHDDSDEEFVLYN